MLSKIDHIGIAVENLKEAIELYEKLLGVPCEKIETIASQKVKTAFFKLGEVHIELLEATEADSPIAKFIARKGAGVHHIAYHTDDCEAQAKQAKGQGLRPLTEKPVDGANGKQIIFLHPKETLGVLTEFCQH
jgi:methylmalonyl-CoA/ethylmalonyl-CoA epimerase